AGKAGLADLTAQMLLRGVGGWTAERLKEELGDIGGRLEITTGWDSTDIKLLGNGANIDALIEILGRVVTLPKFREDDFNQLKTERLKALDSAANPATAVEEAFYRALYDTHPYGHNIVGTKESIAQIGRFDAQEFYERFFIANNSALIIAGDVSDEHIAPLIRKAFGGWRKGQVPPYTFVPPKTTTGVNIRLIERPDRQTAEIRLGSLALRRADPDYFPMLALTNVRNRRFDKVVTKVQSVRSARKPRGVLLFSATIPSKDAADAISTLIAEIKKAADGVDTSELQTVKDGLLEEHAVSLKTNTDLAAR